MNTKRNQLRKIFRRTLFLDILLDRRTRPIFIYALFIIGIGVVLFHWLEGWSWLDSFYFVIITLTTIGYGNFSPTTPGTKLITIFYGLNGIILLLMLFDAIRQVRGWTIEAARNQSDESSDSGE